MAFLSLFSPPVNHYVKWFITETLLHSGSGPSHPQLFSPVTLRGRKKENILDKGPVSTSYGKLAAFAKVEIPITSHCEDAPKGSLATRNSAKVSTPLPDPQLRAKMLFSLMSASIYLVQSSPLLEPSKIPKMHLWDTEVLSCLKRVAMGLLHPNRCALQVQWVCLGGIVRPWEFSQDRNNSAETKGRVGGGWCMLVTKIMERKTKKYSMSL